MKIYWIDKTGKSMGVMQKLQERCQETIELKDTTNFRSTKNDWMIVRDNGMLEESFFKKSGHMVVLTPSQNPKVLWEIAQQEKVEDIMMTSCQEDYLVERILKNIEERKGVS